jgi:hypothetical protein
LKKEDRLQKKLLDTAFQIWVAYDHRQERKYIQLILTCSHFGDLAIQLKMSNEWLAEEVMKVSKQINYRKGICSWPKLIYENYAEVFNKTQTSTQGWTGHILSVSAR